MTTQSVVLKMQKGPSTIKRAKFGPGMLLQHEDLEQLNSYTRDLSRLLFRSFFGCGVICGLTVSAKENCGQTMVTVDAGVALTCTGDPIHVPKSVTFAATDGCDPNNPGPNPLWVWLCSCPKCCAPRTPSCGCDDGDGSPECTREVDWYEIHLGADKPDCACGCEPPKTATDSAPPPLEATGAQLPGAPAVANTAAPTAPASADGGDEDPCRCVKAPAPCYEDHYAGKCGCNCEDSNCVVLALLQYNGTDHTWKPDYRVRRFIRPVLMRDPETVEPAAKKKAAAKKKQ